MSIIIGFGSKARVGKDYACSVLADHYDVQRIAFADELKKDIANLLWTHGLDYYYLESDETQKRVIRPLLVAHGQVMRHYNPNIWVEKALKDKVFLEELTIITDVRFPNEAEYIKKLGGYYVEIDADVPPANETEALYSPQMVKLADFRIKNNFDETYEQALLFLVEHIKKLNPVLEKQG
jgi:hypothetical protein